MSLLLLNASPAAPVASLLRPTMDRKTFLVNGEAWRYKGVTAFKLIELHRRGEDIRPFVRTYTALRYNTFRMLANKPAVAGIDEGWSTPPLDAVLGCLDVLASEGVYGEVTLFGSKVDSGFVPSWIDALRGVPNALVEGVNEPGHEHQWETTEPIDSLVLPRAGDLPYATGNYDPAKPMRGSYATVHTDRADPCDTARKGKAILEMYDGFEGYAGYRVPWVGDEPAKPQDIGYRADCFMALFGIYSLFGAGGTFHSLDGQFGRLPSEADLTCARAAAVALNAFPADTPNRYGYAHGDVQKADEAASGSLRTYGCGPYGVRVCPNPGYAILMGV